jgi:hypothetical protein
MKHIVSVSLGSSTRDHKAEVELLGETFIIERLGMDGDFAKLRQTIAQLDGKVDALGLGGITMTLPVADRSYTIRSAAPLMKIAQETPIVDGTELRTVLERQVILDLDRSGTVPMQGKKVLVVTAVDRYSMAQAFRELKCQVLFGDLIFALGIPKIIRGFNAFHLVVKALAPLACLLPFSMLYPTGTKEEKVENAERYSKYYHEVDIIAGDFNYIHRYLPRDLKGKIVVTNTVTSDNIRELRNRGVKTLVTTTPNLGGRSFGTNVIQATIVAALGKKPAQISDEEYLSAAKRIGFLPRVEYFA